MAPSTVKEEIDLNKSLENVTENNENNDNNDNTIIYNENNENNTIIYTDNINKDRNVSDNSNNNISEYQYEYEIQNEINNGEGGLEIIENLGEDTVTNVSIISEKSKNEYNNTSTKSKLIFLSNLF